MCLPSKDRILIWTLRSFGVLAGAIVVFIVLFLVVESIPALSEIGITHFFTDAGWHPSQGSFQLTPMIVGTLLAAFGAIALAAPLGICSALFCQYYAPPWLAVMNRRLIELLAGIPSVIYGFWGLVVLVPLIARWQPPGASLLAAVAVLTIMILPTVALFALAALQKVPTAHLHGAAAVGLSRWRTIWHIALPSARSGITTGIILALGRALGETMAVLMVCGNVVQSPSSVFQPIRTLTANIALEMGYASGDHRSALFVSGLLLMAAVVILVAAAEWLSRGRIYD